MFVLGLLTCVVLRAFSAQAKVVDSFDECKEFFYQGKEPSGMDQNAMKICQKLENRGFYYASLYSVHHKIPLYSAYTLDPACTTDNQRANTWHLEPQISQSTSTIDHMVREDRNTENIYKGNQAISSDYSGTGYDRGHLNPNSFQCGVGRTATFTLTNAAPMIGRFNRAHWRGCERTLRSYLIQRLVMDAGLATAFIVTGTVPDLNVRIPEDRKKVTVPSHIWTAVCYKHLLSDHKSFSFGYIVRNQEEEPVIHVMSVSKLNNELQWYFGTHQPIGIFADDCFSDENKLVEIQAVFQKLSNLPVSQAGMQGTSLAVKRTFSSDSTPGKKVKVDENTGKIAFDSMSTYYSLAEELKVFALSACLITYVKSQVREIHDELRKREVSAGSDAVECLLVPEEQKTAADGSVCISVTESDYSCQCNTGGETKPCCSSPCLYQNKFNGYRCYADQKLIECSPPYSRITVNGKRCLDNHPCATYGKDYYWCWTNYSPFFLDLEWDYCSPPLWNSKANNGKYCRSNHACAKYGSRYTWCYTDDKGNWDYCCTNCSQ
ncbi:hypothetical protein KOW79_001513 [Hemibagrus wyckioides]|uniref:Uncharacterized protein n=1 Tax=Hemibagrus wyckioides TaxID=337641 RepID=A0A9D3P5I6_9TELE|nr:uncharacterized protein LOC131344099 [Hemibagrus wyckioides]KAG7334917.1 hypothetical protein KOW79_001513 [Hemibagrus wyckioides]